MASKPETTLTLRSAIWNRETRRSIMNKALLISAEELEDKLKDNIDNSTPAGRLWNVGGMGQGSGAKKNAQPKSAGKKKRAFVTPVFHQASAKDQPPARQTSALYNSLKVSRVPSKLQLMASANAPGASILDDPDKLSRPFFRTIIDAYRKTEFVDRVKQSIKELLAPG